MLERFHVVDVDQLVKHCRRCRCWKIGDGVVECLFCRLPRAGENLAGDDPKTDLDALYDVAIDVTAVLGTSLMPIS